MSPQLCSEPVRSEFADDPDFAELLEMFLESAHEKRTEIQSAFERQEWDGIRVLAHQLKGAGGGYGFPGLTSVSGDLESACKSKDINQIGETLNSLLGYIDRLSP